METAPAAKSALPGSRVDRAEATRIVAEARHLYDVAELVQARRIVGGIDSAVLAHRSLALVLRLLVRLHGDPVPDGFRELVERARVIVASENLLAEDLSSELCIIDEMRERFVQLGDETTPADDRRYDRAFVRSAEWLAAVRTYVDQKLPPPESRLRRHLAPVFGVGFAFLVGFAVGRHVRPESPAVTQAVAPVATVTPTGPTFAATFYNDTAFGTQVLTRRDPSIAFDWGADAPAESMPIDHFSIRWEGTLNVTEPGTYSFYLTSDDGSRLFLDNAIAIDNWGGHAAVAKASPIELTKGTHPIRVEFFDEIGPALIKLEWSGERFERRLITSADLR